MTEQRSRGSQEFDADQDALNAVNDCLQGLSENVLGDKALKQMLCSLPEYDLDGVFISNDLQLTEISQRMFGRWNAIQEAVVCDIKRNMPPKRKEAEEKYEERIADVFKRTGSFSIKYLNECLSQMASGDGEVQTVDGYFAKLGAIDTAAQQCENVFAKIANAYVDVKSLLTSNYPEEKSLAQDKDSVAKIKELLDSIKALQRFVKPLLGSTRGQQRRTLLWRVVFFVGRTRHGDPFVQHDKKLHDAKALFPKEDKVEF